MPHELSWAAVALTAAAVLTAPITVIAFAERWWLGALLLPYQVWVALAASLSWGYVAKGDPEVDPTLLSALREVIERGAPAQRAEARRLADAIQDAPINAQNVADAVRLVDAYLNDPYLERG